MLLCSKKGMLTVMMSVFEGGDGSTSGGRSERSRESGDLLPDDARERIGDGGRVACMFAIIYVAQRYTVICWLSCCGELEGKRPTACVLYQSSPSAVGRCSARTQAATVAPPQSAKARLRPCHFPRPCPMSLLLSRHFLGTIALPRPIAPQRTVLLEVSGPRRTRQ